MPILVKMQLGPFIMEVQYFEEYLYSNDGKIPADMAAHALWYYYICAMNNYVRAKKNLVYEDEPSIIWNMDRARALLQSIANLYGVPVEKMIRFWDCCEAQRIALGGGDTLPEEFKFKFSAIQ